MGRVLVLPTAIGADEVMQSLGCSRSTAYALIARLRREAGLPVARGTLARVDLRTFQAYYAREYEGDGCAYNSEGRSGTAPTTRRSRAASASGAERRPAATTARQQRRQLANSNAGELIPFTRPRGA